MMDRLAIIGAVVVFVAVASFLSLFVLTVNPRYLTFSGFLVFYAALFVALWSLLYALAHFAVRNRRRRPAALARRTALTACALAGIVLLSHLRFLSVYTALVVIALAAGAEYFLNRR